MKKLKIILDPAHGSNVSGKQSPDGLHKEYQWSRKVCQWMKTILEGRGYAVTITVNDDIEPGLNYRTKQANEIPGQTFFISLHNNAAGNLNQWMEARGFEIWTSPGETNSDVYATIIFDELVKDFPKYKSRSDYADGDPDKESAFYVLKHTHCPAVLIEWLFQDNRRDVELLQNETVTAAFCTTLANAIDKINDQL